MRTRLSHLRDDELLRHAENERDALTTTDVEIELIARLSALVESPPLPSELEEALDAAVIDADDLPELVKILDEFHATDAKSLRQKLERADKFYDIANDAGDVIERLSSLVSSTL